jgi:crotonobetaine/carnitine-CoA ligase
MAYYMVPRYVEFLLELPRNMSEKVHKRDLRAAAESRLPQVWDRERAGIHLSR